MAIRINLLAEQRALEDLRRRDPVKRAMWAAGFIVAVGVIWGGYLQVKLMGATREVDRVEAEYKKLEPDYKKVTADLDRTADAERKYGALQSLATNRFLWAPALNALQYAIVPVDDVQIVGLKTDQRYITTAAIKPSTNSVGNVSHGKPGTSREKTTLALDAKDLSKNPGEQIFKFQEAIANYPYFKSNLEKTELAQRTPVQTDSDRKKFVQFTIECRYRESVR